MAGNPADARYDGIGSDEIARLLTLPRVVVRAAVTSTLDVAHDQARGGAPGGTLILADSQTAGRGRMGRSWRSEAGAGVWLTLIERPRDGTIIDVLSLRIGIALAPALEAFSVDPVRLKWPNDVYAGGRKLAGVLVEARWRDGVPEWIAIGVGINLRPPASEPAAIGLRDGVRRLEVLEAVVPAIRAAATRSGPLDASELAAFAARDLAAGRECIEPAIGRVRGIDGSGALLVDVGSTGSTDSSLSVVRAGSLVLKEER